MFRLLVLADDFTGALDTGIQFARRGVSTTVFLYDGLTAQALCGGAQQVAVVDTESRHIPPAEAAQRVAQITALCLKLGCRHFYKKTDSTLRGNIGSELNAMREACAMARLVFVPALPELGRRTVNGVQYVGQTPLACSEFADDPFNPIRHSAVAEILAEQTACPARSIRPAECGALRACETPEIVIVDAETDRELSVIGQGLLDSGNLSCLAGCAGFAGVLPELLQMQRQFPAVPRAEGGTLLVCGSIHPQAVQQCRWAAEHCGYLDRPLSIRQMLSQSEDRTALVASVRERLSAGGKVLLRVAGGRELLAQTYAEAQTLEIAEESVPACIAWNMGTLTRQLLEQLPLRALIVFGGDTLMGIAAALHCRSVTPLAQLVPGVVLSELQRPDGTLRLVTKAGGFSETAVVSGIDAALCGDAAESKGASQ